MPLKKDRFPQIASAIDDEIEQRLLGIGNLIANDARSRVPEDTHALHDAIHVDVDLATLRVSVIAGDSDVFYGHIVEGGSAAGGKGRGPIPPRPFLIPAYEAKRDEVIREMREALKDAERRG